MQHILPYGGLPSDVTTPIFTFVESPRPNNVLPCWLYAVIFNRLKVMGL